MSCDIISFAECKNKNIGQWEQVHGAFSMNYYDGEIGKCDEPFYWQDYLMYGVLADVRNDHGATPISNRKGIPKDVDIGILLEYQRDRDSLGIFGASYLTLRELIEFDYEKTFLDIRHEPNTTHTYRERLGDLFFTHIEELKQLGNPDDVRIVFWFAN